MKRLLLLIFAAMLALAAPAAAHVTVSAPGAARDGADVAITFRVPNEEKQATTAVTVQLPTDTPIAGVGVQTTPGWTITQKTATLATPIKTDDGEITEAVTEVTWTATAGGIPVGEFASFTLLAGQLPDVASLTFRALQTYADGSVVSWIETASPGSSDEPEHPAPVLTLAAAATPSTTKTATASSSSSSSSNTTLPTVLSIIALVLAAGALGVTVLRRRA